jgi:hypothetical protein
MPSTSKVNKPSLVPADIQGSTGAPTKPGWYLFQGEPPSREAMVQVNETNGKLTVWWPNKNQPVAKLKGRWRGPIPPSTGLGSR